MSTNLGFHLNECQQQLLLDEIENFEKIHPESTAFVPGPIFSLANCFKNNWLLDAWLLLLCQLKFVKAEESCITTSIF